MTNPQAVTDERPRTALRSASESGRMRTDKNGGWVRYADYEAMRNYALALESRNRSLRSRSQDGQWVYVKERLPPAKQIVLAYFDHGEYLPEIRLSSWFQWENMPKPLWSPGIREYGVVTHWRPLDAPPSYRSAEPDKEMES